MNGRAQKIATAMLVVLMMVSLPALAGSRIEREYELASGGKLVVDTDLGSVTVRGTSSDGVRLLITSRTEDLLSSFDLEVESSDEGLEISFEKKGSRTRSWLSWGRGQNVKFELEVPQNTEISIDTSGGSIVVEEIDNEVRLDTSGGSIVAQTIGGAVYADTSGGSIVVEDADGDVDADTSGGSIVVSGARGDVRADTSGGSIAIDRVAGDIMADTSGGSIGIEGAGGYVTADTSGGAVSVSFAPGNARGGTLSTSGGGIDVEIDASVSLDIDAVASGGSVVTNVPISVEGKLSKSSVRGRMGSGGNVLKLRASGGKIRIDPI